MFSLIFFKFVGTPPTLILIQIPSSGLRSGETIIRWSAAKGIGRVTARLPKDLADEVLCSILQLFSLRLVVYFFNDLLSIAKLLYLKS